jgi:hypothetical protein
VMSMEMAEELADLLDRLKNDPSNPLRGFSPPRRNKPPFPIRLAAWATEIAADLDNRYGDFVVLEVGHLNYPAGTRSSIRPRADRPPLIDALDVSVATVEDLEVRSGYNLRSTILIQNSGQDPLVIATNGVVQSVIVEPASGEVVGSFAGAQPLPLVRFRADPGQAISAPVLIGSASLRPELGYSVPPGLWGVEAILKIEGVGRYRTRQLPIAITG